MLTSEQALKQSKSRLAKLQEQAVVSVSIAIDRAAGDGLTYVTVDVPKQAGGHVVEQLNANGYKVTPRPNDDGTDAISISWS